MTLAEALRIYDINITVDEFLLYCLIALIGYGLLVGIWTCFVMIVQHFKTKRTFIKYELPRLHRRIVQKLKNEKQTLENKNKLLEEMLEKYFVKLKLIDEARGAEK